MNKKMIAAIVALVLAGTGFGGWKYYENNKIKEMREAGIGELTAAINLDDYREAEQEEINKIIADTEAKINESKDEAEIKSMVSEASDKFTKVKTKSQYVKDEAVKKLNELVNLDDYREAEQKEIKETLTAAEAKVKELDDEAEIDSLINKTAESFAALKTDAQYAEEEAAAAAAKAAASKKKSKKKKSSSNGCVGGGSDAFY